MPFERHDEDVPAVEDRNRHQVEQSEVEADRWPSGRRARSSRAVPIRRTAGRSRPAPSAASASSRVTSPRTRLKISPGGLDVPLHAHRDRLDRPGLDAQRVVDGPHAEPSDSRPSDRRDGQRLLHAAAIDRDLIGFSGCFAMAPASDTWKVIGLPSTATITSPALRPPRRPVAGRHRCEVRVRRPAARRCRRSRTASAPARGRRDLERRRLTVAQDPKIDFAVGARSNRDVQIAPRSSTVRSFTASMRSPGRTPAPAAGEPRDRADHRRLILVDAAPRRPDRAQRREHDREQEVHGRAHDQHLEPLPFASSTGTRRGCAAVALDSSGFSPAIFT